MSNLFLSERNLVIITFNKESSTNSILDRLLKVANKNLLPVSLMILSTDPIGDDQMTKVKLNLFESIKQLKNDLKSSVDKFIESKEFPQRVQLSQQVNLIEQLKLFEKIVNFAAFSSDADVSVE